MLFDITSAPMAPAAKLDLVRNIGELFTGAVSQDAILADFAARTGFTPDPDKVVFVPHHLAHAMTGYYMAGMKDAAFLASDGRAERFSSLIGEIRDGRIRVFDESTIGAEYSMGLLFAAITRYLGFVPNNDEYKITGLSGFAHRTRSLSTSSNCTRTGDTASVGPLRRTTPAASKPCSSGISVLHRTPSSTRHVWPQRHRRC